MDSATYVAVSADSQTVAAVQHCEVPYPRALSNFRVLTVLGQNDAERADVSCLYSTFAAALKLKLAGC